jgi:hypothetical protein
MWTHDKARDQEIATLGTVLQCISNNNLESVDLLNEIQCKNKRKLKIDHQDSR